MARSVCEEEGARLAIIKDEESFNLTNQHFRGNGYWVAGTDADSEGQWYWIDEFDNKEDFSFVKWDELGNQPDGDSRVNCMRQWDRGWTDNSCKTTLKFLCQRITIKSRS